MPKRQELRGQGEVESFLDGRGVETVAEEEQILLEEEGANMIGATVKGAIKDADKSGGSAHAACCVVAYWEGKDYGFVDSHKLCLGPG